MSARGGRRVRLVQVPVGVGGADDPVPAPRDDEQHAASRCAGSARWWSGSGPAARRGGCPWTRGRGTGRAAPTSAWVSSVHTPVALITCRARTSNSLAGLQVDARRAPVTRSPSRRKPMTRDAVRDQRAERAPRCGRRSWCAGRRRPGRRSTGSRRSERVLAQARRHRAGARAGSGAGGAGSPRAVPRRRRPSRRRAAMPGADVGALPDPVRAAGRGTAPAGPGAGRAASSSSPRSRSASRTSPKSSISR